MRFEFDAAKDKANIAKHGISLEMAEFLDWNYAQAKLDDRFAYRGERRMIALVPANGVVYFIVFVERGETLRVISLRKANKKEVISYVEQN
jgi:uncharacterized DUF497 family protein